MHKARNVYLSKEPFALYSVTFFIVFGFVSSGRSEHTHLGAHELSHSAYMCMFVRWPVCAVYVSQL